MFDTRKTQQEVAIDVVQAVACMHPGPTAILYVISVANRYTQEENDVSERLKCLLDKHVTEYMIIIFTRGNELRQKRQTIEDFLSEAPSDLQRPGDDDETSSRASGDTKDGVRETGKEES